MPRLFVLSASLVVCLLAATVAQSLTVGYGQRDIAMAGPGCVGGWISAHANTAYFRGDTELLNANLASLAAGTANRAQMTVVLHAGAMLVDNPEEQPLTGFGNREPNRLAIDWSVRKICPPDACVAGRCKCNRRNITVDVWVTNQIRLADLSVPAGVSVKSGGEIEQFIESHATRN